MPIKCPDDEELSTTMTKESVPQMCCSDLQRAASEHDQTTSGFHIDTEKCVYNSRRTSFRFSLLDTFYWTMGPVNKLSARIPGINVSNNGTPPTENQTLETICYNLSPLNDDSPRKTPNTSFGIQQLSLSIKLLGGVKFALTTPPPAPGKPQQLMVQAPAKHSITESRVKDAFIKLLPQSCQKVSEKASPLGLVPKLLPPHLISHQARFVGSSFWTWLCIVDDLTESLIGEDWKRTEDDLLHVFGMEYQDIARYNDYNSDCVRVSLALRRVIETTIVGSMSQRLWRYSFNAAIREIVIGFREERPFVESKDITMMEWMRLRVITISARPFFILARADIGLSATVSKFGNPLDPGYLALVASGKETNLATIRKIESLLQIILGLQNDILGWEKDSATNNPLSAIQILIQQGVPPATAVSDVISVHNSLVYDCLAKAQAVWEAPTDRSNFEHSTKRTRRFFKSFRTSSDKKDVEKIRKYLQVIVGFAHGMPHWMAVSKRYLAQGITRLG